MSNLPAPVSREENPRWRAIRDVAVFHFKLFAGGLLVTLLLSPLSLVAAALDFVLGKRENRSLDAVLRLGRRLEHWVNLYGTLSDGPASRENLDGHLRQLEEAAQDLRRTSSRR